jgi:uncharacterized repeat protein (TIGR01451 family)
MRTRIPRLTRCICSNRLFLPFAALAFVIFVLGLYPQAALAQSSPGGGVDDSAGPFQLDSNATTDTAICFKVSSAGALLLPTATNPCSDATFTYIPFSATSDDWANALKFPGHPAAGSALATSFVGPSTNPAEPVNSLNDNTFFGGGSKDTLGISSGPWEYQLTSTPAKDDIEHAFAAAYTYSSPNTGGPAHNGDTVIYFGMDRVDNSGDATAGFWFFQDSSISLSTTKKGGGFIFTGHHANGDLLIVSDFSQGGAIGSLQAFTWSCGTSTPSATCDSGGSLKSVTALLTAGITCDPITGNSSFCGIVNDTDGLTSPWGFVDTKNVATTFSHGEFLEGGIDLQNIFGANVPCFSTFMAETRSSNKPDSALQDLTPPVSFPLCGISVTKTCVGNGVLSNGGSTVTYSWTVTATNTGIGNLYDVTVVDTLPDGVTENISLINESTTPNFLGAKLSASATVTFVVNCSAGVCTGAETGGGSVTNPASVTNTADVHAFTAPSNGGTEIFPSPDVPQTSICLASSPGAINVTKHCDATNGGPVLVSQGGFVVVKVPFTAQVCVPMTVNGVPAEGVDNITMSDSPSATFTSNGTISSINPGDCKTVTGYYFPSAVDAGSDGLIAGRYFFTDTLTAKGKGAIDGATITNPALTGGVTCPICPSSECDGALP